MTLKELKKTYTDIFLLKDDMILDVIVSLAIHGKMPGDGIWLLIVGGSSSGKSELVNTLNKVPFVFPISTLTENTFLSNMKLGNGQEASLLHRIGPLGVITMKDFTTVLSMRGDKSDVLISQLREIYDGHMVKLAGNGNSESWDGKINWLGATTESVYLAEDETAGMGRRTINYVMPDQDRRETTLRAKDNNHDIDQKRNQIQDAFAEYILEQIDDLPLELPDLSEDFQDEIVDIADFVTHIRTPTARNFKGDLVLVPALEMPMRAFSMLTSIAKVLFYLHSKEGTLEENLPKIKEVVNKIAFDSIPKQKTLIVTLLAKYKKLTTKGVAQRLRYPTDTCREWLENVNVLGICERQGGDTGEGQSGPDTWVIVDKYRDIMVKYGGVKPTEENLFDISERLLNYNEIQPAWMVDSMPKPTGLRTDDPGALKELKSKEEEDAQKRFDSW